MIDFLIVNYKTFDFIKILIKSIKKFCNCEFYVYIIDNSNDMNKFVKENYGKNIIVKKIEMVIQENLVNKDVLGHATGINQAFSMGTSKYVCVLDPDTVFVNYWVNDLELLLEKYNFVSNRYEPKKKIARPQFMFFKRSFFIYNNLRFTTELDTGGNITRFCMDHHLDYYILENSYNNKALKDYHVYPEIHCEQAFINGHPFFLHQGRGSVKGDRSKWFSILGKAYGN